MRQVDLIILGGGLAGAALAWQAYLKSWRVLLIDRKERDTASRVAAGLVTPITGSRAAASWRWSDFFPVARHLYTEIENRTNSHFWDESPVIKIFCSESERELYQDRWITGTATSELDITVQMLPSRSVPGYKAPFGACQMAPAARLDTTRYLEATYDYFLSRDSFRIQDVQCETDLDLLEDGTFVLKSLSMQASRIAMCQGFASRENRFFSRLPLHPARGDVLRIRCEAELATEVVHSDAWTIPKAKHEYLVGATYDRSCLTSDTSELNPKAKEFRQQLLDRWRQMVTGHESPQIIEHRAAVRPASYDRHPLIGKHREIKNMYCLNGLGSKGSLMSPLLARILLESMDGIPIPRELDWQRR